MKVDPRRLQIKLVRGRTQTMLMYVGNWSHTAPDPAGNMSWSWTPTDITGWLFTFTMRTNYTYKQPVIAISYNPITNQADPTQGQFMWNILGKDTEPLAIACYVWDLTVVLSDNQPRFFCGGTAPLLDNVTDVVNIP